jgi:hypothetical protein
MAMQTSRKYYPGDVVSILRSNVTLIEVAVLRAKFVHKNGYGDIVNRYFYQLDSSDSWYHEDHLIKAKVEVEEDMTAVN